MCTYFCLSDIDDAIEGDPFLPSTVLFVTSFPQPVVYHRIALADRSSKLDRLIVARLNTGFRYRTRRTPCSAVERQQDSGQRESSLASCEE